MLYPISCMSVTAEEFAWIIAIHKKANLIKNVTIQTVVDSPMHTRNNWLVGEVIVGKTMGCLSKLLENPAKGDCYVNHSRVELGIRDAVVNTALASDELNELINLDANSRNRYFTIACYSVSKEF